VRLSNKAATAPTLRLWIGCVAVVYVTLSIAGLTTSSLGTPALSERIGENAPGVLIGTPRGIRIDEWNRRTPWLLGLMARGDDGFLSPLSFPEVGLVAPTARDVPSAALHWEAVAAKVAPLLPDAMLFAAIWWFPVALAAALLPLWLGRLGVKPGIAVATTCLVLLAPVNHWWSWIPLVLLAPALLGAVLALAALDRVRLKGFDLVALGALALAALCVAKVGLGYAPWSIPLATAIFVPTLVSELVSGARRHALVCLGAVIAAGVGLALVVVVKTGALDVLATTVYPGSRRSAGEYVGRGALFGAPHAWFLQTGVTIGSETNESELTSGYLVLLVPSAVLTIATRWRAAQVRAPAFAAGGVLLASLSWVIVDWPTSLGLRLAPLSLVPPERLAQVLGLVATIVFGLVLSAWRDEPRFARDRTALAAGALTALATALGGRALHDKALPTLSTASVAVVALLVGSLIAGVIWRPGGRALAAVPVAALFVVFAANPLQRGLGDLRSSDAVVAVSEVGRQHGDDARWASDDFTFDALLMASGQLSLTGQQWVGPQDAAWRLLDPRGRARDSWNRGASYIRFEWAPGAQTLITNTDDSVLVRVDPCAPALRRLELALLVSTRALEAPCLVPHGRVRWGAFDRLVYRVRSSRRLPSGE